MANNKTAIKITFLYMFKGMRACVRVRVCASVYICACVRGYVYKGFNEINKKNLKLKQNEK